VKSRNWKPKPAKRSDTFRQELIEDLEKLCLRVACLDDAGLPVQHKSAIEEARRLRRYLPVD
jgi:hypothetical protein